MKYLYKLEHTKKNPNMIKKPVFWKSLITFLKIRKNDVSWFFRCYDNDKNNTQYENIDLVTYEIKEIKRENYRTYLLNNRNEIENIIV